mgnify:CR=1 FL=1
MVLRLLRFFVLWITAAFTPNVFASEPEIGVDGQADEAFWSDAQTFDAFTITQPLTLAEPGVRTHVRLASLPGGLAVHFHCEQPKSVTAVSPARARDASPMDSDLVYVMIDFDATASRGYEFTVSRANTQRDGTISNEKTFSYDWDARWQSATYEEESAWSVELLIPWSVVPSAAAQKDSRTLALHFGRVLGATGERHAWPSLSFERPRYLSDFARVEVSAHRQSSLDVIPYASVRGDLIDRTVDWRAGMDLFWKPGGAFQLSVALKPDFGQVESDDLVVNFDAIETFRSDKRPFFTQNQGLFDLTTARGDLLVYTRRIGGASDLGDGSAADIDAALKMTGRLGTWDYGTFGASEADAAGREFYAVRSLRANPDLSIGHLATFTERPSIDRSAMVNAVDVRWRLHPTLNFSGMLIHSDVTDEQIAQHGNGAWMTWLYAPRPEWSFDLSATHHDGDLDFNDSGFMRRNDLNQVFFSGNYRDTLHASGSSNVVVTWTVTSSYLANDSGQRLAGFNNLSRTAERVGGGKHFTELRYDPSGFDDLVSRGNGLVRRDQRLDFWHYYDSPRIGRWKFQLGGWLFQEGNDKHAFQLETQVNYQAAETVNVGLTVYPRWSRDWFVWRESNLFASYQRDYLYTDLQANWLPAKKHEIRLKAQWIVFDAHHGRALRSDAGGVLNPSADTAPDLSVSNFGLQLRYRFELAPQREIYLVYARGGYAEAEEHSRGVLDLLGTASRLRDADQVLAKLQWRF